MKRTQLALSITSVMLFLAGSLFASGQEESAAPQAAAEPMELEFNSWQATEPGTSDFWKALNAEFQVQHPEVTINFSHLPYPVYTKTMITRFAADDTPDIFHFPAANLFAFAREGWLEPLDSYLESTDILASWIPLQEDWNRYEGDTVALMVLGYGHIMGYNERMFNEEGLAVPTTAKQAAEAAARLTKDTNGDKVIDQFGWAVASKTHPDVVGNFHQACIGLSGKNILDEAGNFNADVVAAGLKYYKNIVGNGYTPIGLDSNGRRAAFSEGRAAIMIEGPWIEGYIDKAPDDVRPNLKVGAFPYEYVSGGPSNALGIPSALSGKKKAMVAEYLKLFATPEWQGQYALLAGQPPSRKGAITPEILTERPNMGIYAEAASKAVRSVPPGLEINYTEWRTTMVDIILEYLLQDKDLDQIVDQVRELSLELKE